LESQVLGRCGQEAGRYCSDIYARRADGVSNRDRQGSCSNVVWATVGGPRQIYGDNLRGTLEGVFNKDFDRRRAEDLIDGGNELYGRSSRDDTKVTVSEPLEVELEPIVKAAPLKRELGLREKAPESQIRKNFGESKPPVLAKKIESVRYFF
jgi:hypothetical protein